VETYKAGQQEKEQNAPDLSQQTPVTFPIVSPEAKRLCGDAVVAPLTNPQVWEHKSLEGAVKALPPLPPEGPTMSSREIAELTGKRHADVLRDIRSMLEDLQIDACKFASVYVDAKGEKRSACCLPKDLTITLVSGYNVTMRHRIVTRWMELEAAQAPAPSFALPKTFAEALRLSADLQEANKNH